MKKKKQKVQMPAGIRQKLMAAVSMLMVSIIMLVSSTYAWFTLSTAPEVTGISTSVGANGNLEMALLNTDTYADTSTITSQVGDSSSTANRKVTEANITWGNLVDLSDTSYGLKQITLYPSTLSTDKDVAADAATIVNTATPLSTPVYGADGRVASLDANTGSAVYKDGKFTVEDKQSYGVRAVGAAAGISTRYLAFNSAKSVVTAGLSGNASRTKSAITTNSATFMVLAMAAQEGKMPTSYTKAQVQGILAVAEGMQADLNTIVNIYKNAAIAAAATEAEATDETFATARQAIEAMTPTQLADKYPAFADVATAITDVKSVSDTLNGLLTTEATKDNDTYTAETVLPSVEKLLGTSFPHTTVDAADGGKDVYLTGGALNTIAGQTGTFEVASAFAIRVYAGAQTGTAALDSVKDTVNKLTAPDSASGDKSIADTYGYILDFAFRTNAATSNLQLQTKAVNRVYSDAEGTDLATQGSGSTVTFTATDTSVNAETLLGALRIVFFNPDDGTIYTTASLDTANAKTEGTKTTADVKVKDQTGNAGTITALTQNTVQKVSVLVYLEGADIDNTAVANAVSSGALDLNLQFSSSETLTPMVNSTLKTMQKTQAGTTTGDQTGTTEGQQ